MANEISRPREACKYYIDANVIKAISSLTRWIVGGIGSVLVALLIMTTVNLVVKDKKLTKDTKSIDAGIDMIFRENFLRNNPTYAAHDPTF